MKFKRIALLALAGLLCLGVTSTAFAADTGQFDLAGRQQVVSNDLSVGQYAVTFASSDDSIKATNCQLKVTSSKSMTVVLTMEEETYSEIFLGTAEKASKDEAINATKSKKGASVFTFAVSSLNTVFDAAFYDTDAAKWTGCEVAILADELYGTQLMGGDFTAEVEDPYEDAVDVGLDDGTYNVEVTLAGGSGRANVTSPCTVTVKDGKAVATVEWSSEHYDYMLVDGYKYLKVNDSGNSTFDIPITSAKYPMDFLADTTAMGAPHEIEYALTFDFDSASAVSSGSTWYIWVAILVVIVVVAAIMVAVNRRRNKKEVL